MKTALLVAAVILLAGCEPTPAVSQRHATISGVTEFVLSDGTRCAAIIGAYRGGITCDWRQR